MFSLLCGIILPSPIYYSHFPKLSKPLPSPPTAAEGQRAGVGLGMASRSARTPLGMELEHGASFGSFPGRSNRKPFRTQGSR